MVQTVRYREGQSLAYSISGDPNGFPVLVQHGMIASIEDAGLFARLIATGTRLVCIARPGYGESSPYEMAAIGEWGDLVAVLADELALTQFDVLGMSSGAPYSYAIGHRLPGRVRNIFVFSGTPALYAAEVRAAWPYPVDQTAGLAELKRVARELFFADLPAGDLSRPEIRDSLRNDCFGIALDLKLRCNDWGFRLSDVPAPVWMRHSRYDPSVPLVAAEMTARLLPHCHLEIVESEVHFSQAALDDYIRQTIAPRFGKEGERYIRW